MRFHRRIFGVVITALGLLAGSLATRAQAADARAEYDKIYKQWRDIVVELQSLNQQVQFAPNQDARDKIRKQAEGLVDTGNKLTPHLKEAAEKAFLAAPDKSKEIADLYRNMASAALQTDEFEEADRMIKLLLEHGYDDLDAYRVAAIAAFMTSDFERSEAMFKKADKVIDAGLKTQFVSQIDEYKRKWAKESKLREEEDKAPEGKQNPQVKLLTSKGEIVVELFENQAPNAVANFISLVEQKFYDGVKFHRVIAGFMAQGGDPTGTGQGGPGYKIACECYREDHREHFRGTLSMAHAGKDTGGSQFFLTFKPTSHLDGRHTVFGRVVKGMDVLAKLKRIEPGDRSGGEPDKIITATVLRKRDHAYTPKKIEG